MTDYPGLGTCHATIQVSATVIERCNWPLVYRTTATGKVAECPMHAMVLPIVTGR